MFRHMEKALEEVDRTLGRWAECPHLWNVRGDLIQLLETKEPPPLKEAEKSYKMALRLNPKDTEAIEALAHFYDSVEPKPRKAKQYAQQFLALTKKRVSEMEQIISGRN